MSPSTLRVAAWLGAHIPHGRPWPERLCPASGWLARLSSVDRLGTGVQCCPHCSAPIRCEHIDLRDVLIPPHRALSSVVVKAVDHG
ncbi:MAG: hypothetical protein ACRD03_02855 [Acidimicrobiales bacterium]